MRLESPWLTHFCRARGAPPAGVSRLCLSPIGRAVYNPASMRVLLLRPDPGNERFGLGPFFRVEPLGLEYIRVLETARAVRRASPGAFIVAGGHAAAAFSLPLETEDLDAVCVDDGE